MAPWHKCRQQREPDIRRIAVDGADKFRANKKTRLGLYGLQRLNDARHDGVISLLIGESDCIAMWFEGIPAIGLPTPRIWDEARDARFFDGFRRINVVLSPHKGQEAMLELIRHSSIRDRVYLVTLPLFKDPAALHFDSPVDFEERWNEAVSRAVPWPAYAKRSELEAREAAKQAAGPLLACPDVLEAAADQCQVIGVTNERNLVQLIYLACVTRLFRDIISLFIKGPSSAGKSYVVKMVMRLFPDKAFLPMTGMSEKALIYTNEPLSHRMLVIYEASGLKDGYTAYLVRTLLSEGHLKYDRPDYSVYKEGPTGLIITTTEEHLHHENETRCLSVTVDETLEQTVAVIRRRFAMYGEELPPVDPKWHALQTDQSHNPLPQQVGTADQTGREPPPTAP
jgi:hypothetical protein